MRQIKMSRIQQQIFLVSLFLGILPGLLGLTAHAQSSVPPSASAGAVLWWQQHDMILHQDQPYLFRPIQASDLLNPGLQDSDITVEQGVLPHQKSIQSLLITPNGHVIISPRED